MKELTIIEEPITTLEDYAGISIEFEISRVLVPRPIDNGLGGIAFEELPVCPPQRKNYDACGHPNEWAKKFDVSRWGMLSAFHGETRIGGCVLAYDTPGVHMLEESRDITVLWDLRVDPAFRRRGVATALFARAVEWSKERDCRGMKIETQNNNVDACCFYARQGCVIRSIDRFAYSEFPDEVQIIWYKQIGCI